MSDHCQKEEVIKHNENMGSGNCEKEKEQGIDNFIDPVRRLSVYRSRTLGNKYKCWYCGEEGETESDHFYPRSLGGMLKVCSCKKCNNEKADLTPLEWINYLRLVRNRWQRNKIKFLQGQAEAEIIKIDRMIRASLTLWLRVKHSVKHNYCPVGTIITKQKKLTLNK
jgi:hypothetical protein